MRIRILLAAATIGAFMPVSCTTLAPTDVQDPTDTVTLDEGSTDAAFDVEQDTNDVSDAAADVSDDTARDIPDIPDIPETFPDIPPIECVSDLACERAWPDLPECWHAFCDKWLGICIVAPQVEGSACDSGNKCIKDGSCIEGQCVGPALDCDDGNPCTDDSCDPEDGCLHTTNKAACEDGNPCTSNDSCINGNCRPGPNSCDCQGDQECAEYEDGNPCNGLIRCLGQKCVLNKSNVPACEAMQDYCLANMCNPETGLCEPTPVNEGSRCDDGNECTVNDVCRGGICAGDAGWCDDGNDCTVDSCVPGEGCIHEFNSAPCDDGNLCTRDDACVMGECKGIRLPECGCILTSECAAFEDSNPCNGTLHCVNGRCVLDPLTVVRCQDPIGKPCQRSACNPATGRCAIVRLEDGRPCADTDSCTFDEACLDGECVGSVVPCNDDNICTDDYCDQYGGCFHSYNTDSCEDGNPCSVSDHCVNGVCIPGENRDCDDGNPCTVDRCSPSSGCYSTPVTESGVSCVPEDPCLVNATCVNGLCVGDRKNCEDGDPCTDNYCDSIDGTCRKRNNSAPCEDGNECTVNDYCNAGICKSGTNRDCSDFDQCTVDRCVVGVGCVNEDKFGCQHCPGGLDSECDSPHLCKIGVCDINADPQGLCVWIADPCDDGNPCTTGSCNEWNGVCTFNPVTGPCDDGNPCTTGDTCNVSTMQCVGVPAVCNDGDPCTDDYCDPADGQCRTNWNTAPCDDKKPCTVEDTCSLGACAGVPKNCEDGNPCTDNFCDPMTGICHDTINAEECEDGNPCTTGDYCELGQCLTGNPKNCSDNNECTTDSCRAADGECLHVPAPGISCGASNKCIVSGVCNSSGLCDAVFKTCNDNNPCTTDSCNPTTGICIFTPNTLPCNDGNACTADDKCFNGVCGGTTITCNDNIACTTDTCNQSTGCVFSPVDSACNDNNACTTDSCSATLGCVNTALPDVPATSCNDNNPCTLSDICKGGICTGTQKDCADTLKCTRDFCNVSNGQCVNEYFVGPCNDDNPCTTNDLCNENAICSGSPVDCNDGIPCTTDYCQSGLGCVNQPNDSACDDRNSCTTNKCVAGSGCVFSPVTTPIACEDGNPCTVSDTCSTTTGTCAGLPKDCSDGNVCTKDSCNTSNGQCSWSAASGPCDDLIACTTGDTCISGICFGTASDALCDDSNACTSDACSTTQKKCIYQFSGASACDDGDPCTDIDMCVDVLCSGTLNCQLPGCSDDPRCAG